MDLSGYFDPDIFAWVILPLFIFFARVLDVTLGTLRIIFLSRGRRTLAPILGFFEVLIWIVAIGQLVQNLTNIVGYLAYAAGFAAGNFIGLLIEEKLAIGMVAIRTITQKDAEELVDRLRSEGYGVTSQDAVGVSGKVHLIYTIIKRKDMIDVMNIIKSLNPRAFVSVEEIRSASEGIFPPPRSHQYRSFFASRLRK